MRPSPLMFLDRAWPMKPSRLEALAHLCEGPLAVRESAADPRAAQKSASPIKNGLEVVDGVAVIPIVGPIFADKEFQNFLEWIGMAYTDPADVPLAVAQALGDPKVQGVLLHVDSPGGEITGVMPAAHALRELAVSSPKPVHAWVAGLDASAAYWISCQVARITADPTAEVGSIGVYTVIRDSSRMAESIGLKVHVIASGPHKGVGVPGAPITDAQLEPFHEQVADLFALFRADVAAGRGASAEQVQGWATGQAWVAGRAAGLGLIDGVEYLGEALTGCRQKSKRTAVVAAEASAIEEETMAEEKKQAEKPVSPAPADLQAEAKAAGMEEGKQAGKAEALSALDTMLAAFPKDQGHALQCFKQGMSVVEAKAAYSDVLAGRVEQLSKELAEAPKAAAAVGVEPVAHVEAGGEADPEAQLKTEHAAEIEAGTFCLDFAAYKALRAAEARGGARVFGRRQ